jgi:hypothetical protein
MSTISIAEFEERRKTSPDPVHEWPNFVHEKPLTNAELDALRVAAIEKGQPLSDQERELILSPK